MQAISGSGLRCMQASATSQCPGSPPVSIRGRRAAPGSQPTNFHLLTGWLAQPRWYPCSEHLGQFHPAPWPDTDAAAAKAGADAAAGDEDVADEGGAAVGGGGGEVKGVPLWAQKSDCWAEPGGSAHTKMSSFSPQCAAAATLL